MMTRKISSKSSYQEKDGENIFKQLKFISYIIVSLLILILRLLSWSVLKKCVSPPFLPPALSLSSVSSVCVSCLYIPCVCVSFVCALSVYMSCVHPVCACAHVCICVYVCVCRLSSLRIFAFNSCSQTSSFTQQMYLARVTYLSDMTIHIRDIPNKNPDHS